MNGYCIVCGTPWPCCFAGRPPAAPPPVFADRELREAARPFAKAIRGYDDSFVGLAAVPPLDEEACSGHALANLTFGDWRRLRAALARSPASVPAPPALDEEDTVELDAYILPVVASVRDAIRAEGQREEDDRDAELESALRGLVAALERKAGEAPR